MKKVFLLALLVAASLAVSSCNQENGISNHEPTSVSLVQKFEILFTKFLKGDLEKNDFTKLNNLLADILFSNSSSISNEDLSILISKFREKFDLHSMNELYNNSNYEAFQQLLIIINSLVINNDYYKDNLQKENSISIYYNLTGSITNDPITSPITPPADSTPITLPSDPQTASLNIDIINLVLKGKKINNNTFDIDLPVNLSINLFMLAPQPDLKCVVDWGDGTVNEFDCGDSSISGFRTAGPFAHTYESIGHKNIQVWLKSGNTWIPNAYFHISPTIDDKFEINFSYNGSDSFYKNNWNFNYSISDEKPDEPYLCGYKFYFVDPPSTTIIKDFSPKPCTASGQSPTVLIDAAGMTYSTTLMLSVDMTVTNSRGATVTKTLTTAVLPPIRVYINSFSLSPNRLSGHGSVTISYDGRLAGYPYGPRPTCELWIDGHLTDEIFPCTGSIVKTFTNPRSYSISHDITFKIYAQIDFGNGDIVRSEDSRTLTLLVDPYDANVSGECYVQSRAGGPYDRKVDCTISPSGHMPPGTYTFSASSTYVCPSLTRTVYSGDNTIRFNCHR